MKTHSKLILLPAGVAIGTILALAVTSLAEDSELDSGPRAIPYNGILEFNGQALNTPVDIQFTLTTEANDCTQTEAHENVQVHAGRFSVNIGSVTGDLDTCLFDAEEVEVSIAVRDADEEGAFTALSGSQRIQPVPFAYWAAEGADFKVDGNLNVTGNIQNPIGDVTVNDKLVVTDIIDARNNIQNATGDVTVSDGMIVTGNLDARGNIQNSNGDVTVSDHMNVSGNLNLRGVIQDPEGDDVFLNDDFTVIGDFDARSNIENSSGDVTVSDDMFVSGTINSSNPIQYNGGAMIRTGTASNGTIITVPSGTTNDWNIFVTCPNFGQRSPGGEGDDALLKVNCRAIPLSTTTYLAIASYEFRVRNSDAEPDISMNLNYILFPK